jgi:hypothetical protein
VSAAISMHRFWVATAIFALVAALCKPVAADATDRPENVFRPLASGEIEMQIGQITEIVMAPGIELVGPLPPEIQNTTVLAAGVVAGGKTPE